MADEIVSINNNKENILEFNLVVEGLDEKHIDAKFVIRSAEMDLSFPCFRNEQGSWSVKLPPLPMLERTAYPFHFDIVAEGYHFEPLKGSINVVGSADVYVTTPKTKLTSPVTKTEVIKEEKKPAVVIPKAQPTKGREKGIEQIARELMEGKKPVETKAPPLAKTQPKVEVIVETPAPPVVAPPLVKVQEPVKVEPKKETPVIKEALLPTIKIEPKKTEKGEKDDAVAAILQEAGMKKAAKKPHRRFSLKDKK